MAKELGIKVTYIPGISSMQASGLAEIPLTHRGISDGVWIITGTRRDGSLSSDLRLALRSKATVVIYMGMKQLPAIAHLYRQQGYGKMPAAIIQNGSLPSQQVAIGTASQLPAMASRHQLSHPAIIVIGDVVSLHRQGLVPATALPATMPGKKRAGIRSASELPDNPAEAGRIQHVQQADDPPPVI